MMVSIDDLHKMWEQDAQIDDMRLDDASKNGASLHAKYLKMYNEARLTYRKRELDLCQLREKKKRYYSGKMTKDEMDEEGWDYDPFKGESKPLKSEMNSFIDSDSDVLKLKLKIEYSKVVTDALKEIIETLRWRHQTIRNMITWRQFEAGN